MEPAEIVSTVDKLLCQALEGLQIQFFNSETRCCEEFTPLVAGEVKLYTCGPTVYNYAHIGNFRTYVFEDLLRRTLAFFGYRVHHVMNITDLDDKTIRGAVNASLSLAEYVAPYTAAFHEDIATLRILPAHDYPAATDYIPQMIPMIETLLEKGVAYKSPDGCVYFSIEAFPRYGRLAHLGQQSLRCGASCRMQADEYDKDSPCDFVLWKAHDPERDGSIAWESPFGMGRPGWHLECSCMAMSLLGTTVDLHCGGVDNLFPHHENEIAQSEALTGEQFVRYWLHSEHLLVQNKKMSKSAGNFYTLRDLLAQGATGEEVRWALLGTHYRSPLNFVPESLSAARAAIQRLSALCCRLHHLPQRPRQAPDLPHRLLQALKEFASSLAADLNISGALAALFDLVRDLNTLIDQDHLSQYDGELAREVLRRMDEVVAVMDGADMTAIPETVCQLVQARQEARCHKNWALADQLRQQLVELGYVVEDTPTGPILKRAAVPGIVELSH